MKHEKVFILTDSCMWEKNKQNKIRSPHAIEVVDIETGQVRFIKSGAIIALVEGDITEEHSQEKYNEENKNLSNNRKNKLQRTTSKRSGKTKIR